MFSEYLKTHDLKTELRGYHPFPDRSNRAAWMSLDQEKREAICQWGDEAKTGYPMLTATQFMAFSRNGSRTVFQEPYYERRRKLMGAVLAECVQDDGGYLDAVIDGLWCICEETTWVVSAHNGSDHPGTKPMTERPLPDADNPYIDLFAAQTAGTLAYTLYFLEDKLNQLSPLLARRVRREIDRRIFTPFLTHDDFWWMGMTRPNVNNWTPWILSNVMECALLLERDELRRCEIIERALPMLDRYLETLPEDGGCDEGTGYFNMAGLALFDCMECLYEATGGKFSFYKEEKIRNIARYPLSAHVEGAYFLNFADCDVKPMLDGARLAHFGKRVGEKALQALGDEIELQREGVKPQDTPQMNRVLFSLFAEPSGESLREPPAFVELPDLQVFAWRKDGLYAAIKGGHNDESHNHNDVGTFVVYADGQPQIIDLGNKVYTALTFGPKRYTLDNTRSKNHNVPWIEGMEQAPGRQYSARSVHADEHGAEMDIAGAYPAGIKKLKRTLVRENGGFSLTDSVELEEEKSVTWVFMLRDEPKIETGKVEFGKMKMLFDEALQASAEEMPVTDKRMAGNFPGSVYRLTLTAKRACSHQQTFRMLRR